MTPAILFSEDAPGKKTLSCPYLGRKANYFLAIIDGSQIEKLPENSMKWAYLLYFNRYSHSGIATDVP